MFVWLYENTAKLMRVDFMLDNRLKKIFDLCPPCKTVADIGCDHGHLPAELIKRGKAERAVAGDISRPSLLKAERFARLCGLSDRIDTRVGSGLDVLLPGEADTVIIAGMGGLLICEILKSAYEKIDKEFFILQPMTGVSELREFLVTEGFCITDEEMAEEGGKLYNIICAKSGKTEDYDTEFGSHLLNKRHPLLKKQTELKKDKLEQILAQIEKSGNNTDVSLLENKLYKCRSVLERW